MSKTENIIIVIILVVVFYSVFHYIVYNVRRLKRAVSSYAKSRGLSVAEKDEDNAFGKMLEDRLSVPPGGVYGDIIRLPLSEGEGYFYSGYKGVESGSKKGASDENLKYFITVFMEIPILGPVFLFSHSEVKGNLLKKMFLLAISIVPGPGGKKALDIEERFPEFAKTHTIFAVNSEDAFDVILTADVVAILMARLPHTYYNILFLPGGLIVEITPLFKSSADVEVFVRLAEGLARYMGVRDDF
ncbi:MAG: hypothetical protein JW984_13520 [Deltaproteobacteria bacterium]|uniref:DUF3137 domain-containing protein n=1 Tax=Candidatus Zymogenus saltonus TaxID=2844893 RepID=A0A9D8KIF3_9DELT|nr:hypothetical protein [Candidatus Zymogenus saltonus]